MEKKVEMEMEKIKQEAKNGNNGNETGNEKTTERQ